MGNPGPPPHRDSTRPAAQAHIGVWARAFVDQVDVLVVGAGPAGSTAAYELARRGHSVLIIEEHGRVGFPVQCAGLVSSRVIELAGSARRVRTPVHGATVYGPGGSQVQFKAPEPRAFVIDRAGLDIDLADRAARAGAVVETGTTYEGRGSPDGNREVALLRGPDRSERSIAARLVIGADGVASALARAYRLRRPVEILPAFEAEFPESPGDPDQVEVDLGHEVAPGLFGWWIPDGSGGGRIGVAAEADGVPARRYFERMLDRRAARTGRAARNPTAYLVSGIPIGTLPKCVGPRVLLVGDAAAQVKPLSGGGIFTGMRCATIAAEVVDAALAADDLSEGCLARYDRLWRRELGGEFSRALYLRRVFRRLTDPDLEALVQALAAAELTGTIVAFGDIDFPTHVARQLLRESPSLLRLLPKALGAWLAGDPASTPELEPGPRRK